MNLTIEQMRQIVDGAPEHTQVVIPCLDGVMYFAKRGDGKWFRYSESYNKWLEYWGKCDPMDLAIKLDAMRLAIADHDTKPCPHGYDIACLICGFGTKDGKRVWNNRKTKSAFDDDRTDFVTDIRNHVAPTTIVLEVHVNEALRLNRLG